MAICKQCGVEIPEGQELCENCIKSQSNTPNTDEKYLDSLLKSISFPQDKEDTKALQDLIEEQDNLELGTLSDTELDSILEDDQNLSQINGLHTDIETNLEELGNEILNSNNSAELESEILNNSNSAELESKVLDNNNPEELQAEALNNISLEELESEALNNINLDELESEALNDINLDELENNVLNDINLDELASDSIDNINLEGEENSSLESDELENLEEDVLNNSLEDIQNTVIEDTALNEADNRGLETIGQEGIEDSPLDAQENNTTDNIGLEQMSEIESDPVYLDDTTETLNTEEIVPEENSQEQDEGKDQELDNVVDNLLNDLDRSGDISLSDTVEEMGEPNIESNSEEIGTMEENETDPMGDVEDLLGLLASEVTEEGENKELGTDGTNVEEVKDDIFSLENIGDIENLLEDAPAESTPVKEIIPENTEEKRKIFNEIEREDESLETNILEDIPSQKELEEKKGLFHKLFGNIFDDKSKKSHRKLEEEEEKSLKKKEKIKEKKEAKKAAKNDPAVKAEKEAIKKAKEEKKAAAKAVKAEKKKEKEEKKKQRLAEEAEEAKKDQGRINPIGATIVFVLAAAATIFVVFGSRSYSYSKSVKEAQKYFSGRDYDLAYEEVRGLNIKDKDLETYDKIITVMYVNKQLNSYNNYYSMKMYPQALDSLLKGLKKYDEYIVTAKKLGVKNDYEYLKKRIIKELKQKFQLSEGQAYKIIDNNDQERYSQRVVEIADKNMKE